MNNWQTMDAALAAVLIVPSVTFCAIWLMVGGIPLPTGGRCGSSTLLAVLLYCFGAGVFFAWAASVDALWWPLLLIGIVTGVLMAGVIASRFGEEKVRRASASVSTVALVTLAASLASGKYGHTIDGVSSTAGPVIAAALLIHLAAQGVDAVYSFYDGLTRPRILLRVVAAAAALFAPLVGTLLASIPEAWDSGWWIYGVVAIAIGEVCAFFAATEPKKPQGRACRAMRAAMEKMRRRSRFGSHRLAS